MCGSAELETSDWSSSQVCHYVLLREKALVLDSAGMIEGAQTFSSLRLLSCSSSLWVSTTSALRFSSNCLCGQEDTGEDDNYRQERYCVHSLYKIIKYLPTADGHKAAFLKSCNKITTLRTPIVNMQLTLAQKHQLSLHPLQQLIPGQKKTNKPDYITCIECIV